MIVVAVVEVVVVAVVVVVVVAVAVAVAVVVVILSLFCIIVVNNDYDWLIDLNSAFAPGFRLLCVFQRTLSSVLSKIGNENCVFDYLIAGSNEYEFCLVRLITLIISLL